MSASREKKKRQSTPEVKTTEAPKKGLCKGLKRALTTVIAIILVLAVVFLCMISTNFFVKNTTGAVANGHKLSPAMLNFYYSYAYSYAQSMLGGAFSTDAPLSEQPYTGEDFETWQDYVLDLAVSTAADTYAIYDKAVAEGYTLAEADQTAIDEQMSTLALYAGMYGYSSANSFIAAQYGPGSTAKLYEEYLTVNTLANSYAQSINDELTYSQEDIDAYYGEHAEEFDSVSYRLFSVTSELFPEATDTEAVSALCEETAKSMAAAAQGNEQAFLDQATELTVVAEDETYDAAAATLKEDVTLASANSLFKEWLADSARQPGDATYISNGEDGYNVLYFVANEDHSFQLPNVRHILISFTSSEDAEAKTATQEEAQAILDEYLAGEQTEEAFAALAQQYSKDNAEDGGLYENIVPGYMVPTFEEWCYDAARQPGDTGIVESSYGYHIMYFVGLGDIYQNYLVENTLRQNDYNAWSDEVTADAVYTISSNAKRFVNDL